MCQEEHLITAAAVPQNKFHFACIRVHESQVHGVMILMCLCSLTYLACHDVYKKSTECCLAWQALRRALAWDSSSCVLGPCVGFAVGLWKVCLSKPTLRTLE